MLICRVRVTWALLACLTATFASAGCAGPSPREQLKAGYQAFEEQRFADATAAADKVLAEEPGRGAAEALYLKGRIAEKRARDVNDPTQARRLLQEARSAYGRALALKPPAPLDSGIRSQLANVAYFQEDYATAVREGTAAAGGSGVQPEDKAWVLYRVGLSLQRLGRFADADRTFKQVQQTLPNSLPARRAMLHQGARAFHVQVGTFTDAANAQRTIQALRAEGYAPVRSTDPTGKQIIGVGPVPTYEQAKSLQARLSLRYADTLILP